MKDTGKEVAHPSFGEQAMEEEITQAIFDGLCNTGAAGLAIDKHAVVLPPESDDQYIDIEWKGNNYRIQVVKVD